MNYLVYLDAQAGELEKILSGVKTMLVKECDPAELASHPVNPGDSLYFLRHKDDGVLRVKATVVRVLYFIKNKDEDLSQLLKELQPRLHLTEAQYNHWSVKEQVQLVEFESAQKMSVIQLVVPAAKGQSDWLAFEAFSLVTQ